MKRELIQLSLAGLAGSLLVTGCIYSHRAAVADVDRPAYPTGRIVVTEAPPPPRTENVGVPPDLSRVWIPGFWTYSDNRWVWINGRWEASPRVNAIWVPGHWDRNTTERGWVWTPGHWE